MGLILADEQFIKYATIEVQNAKKRIDISTFKAEIAHANIATSVLSFFTALQNQAKLGVRIRLLINWNSKRYSVPKTNLLVMRKIKEFGGAVRTLKNNRCCHSKLLIIDNTHAIIGSHNLSVKSCTANFETSYLTTNPDNIKNLTTLYDNVWNNAMKF